MVRKGRRHIRDVDVDRYTVTGVASHIVRPRHLDLSGLKRDVVFDPAPYEALMTYETLCLRCT